MSLWIRDWSFGVTTSKKMYTQYQDSDPIVYQSKKKPSIFPRIAIIVFIALLLFALVVLIGLAILLVFVTRPSPIVGFKNGAVATDSTECSLMGAFTKSILFF